MNADEREALRNLTEWALTAADALCISHRMPPEIVAAREYLKDQPTAAGVARWPNHFYPGHYIEADGTRHPCTCKVNCIRTCRGECGCDACRQAYEDETGGSAMLDHSPHTIPRLLHALERLLECFRRNARTCNGEMIPFPDRIDEVADAQEIVALVRGRQRKAQP